MGTEDFTAERDSVIDGPSSHPGGIRNTCTPPGTTVKHQLSEPAGTGLNSTDN